MLKRNNNSRQVILKRNKSIHLENVKIYVKFSNKQYTIVNNFIPYYGFKPLLHGKCDEFPIDRGP